MNKKHFSFWLRFFIFFIGFAVAFFLMIFLVDRDPIDNFRMLLIKIGILATGSSLFYNIFVESDPEIAD
jgi:ABC-type Fe3+-siderophore transport system permease subunit